MRTGFAIVFALLALSPLVLRAESPLSKDEARRLAIAAGAILKDRCQGCHGDDPKGPRGGLDLRTRDTALRGGESGQPAIVSGKPDASRMYLAVRRAGEVAAMPPKQNDKLSGEQVEVIRRWIAAGAEWPPAGAAEEPAAGVRVATSGGLSPEWTNRKYSPEDLWAYQPVRRPVVSAGKHPVDALLAPRMDAVGLAPAPPADKLALIRRVTFDLTDLPPTPDEIDAFLRDESLIAFEKVVDRLLASPHYGEQMARHWLDVARYADSSGFANDYDRGNAWRYRDYVVRSFNADKPYDRFVKEQIAGDEIDSADPELLIAVGFLRAGPWELTGMEVAKVARQRFLDDVTESVGQVFLGHPLQCARCHDHKFDPVPTRDYYRIQAVFATTQVAERPAAFLPTENTAGFDERKYLEAHRARYEAILKELTAKEEEAGRKWAADRGIDYVRRGEGLRKGIAEEKLPPAHIGLDTRDLGMERIARKGLERLKWEFDRYEPIALSVYAGRTPDVKSVLTPFRLPANRLTSGTLETTHILPGGDPFSPRDPVEPGVLSVISAANPKSEIRNPKQTPISKGPSSKRDSGPDLTHSDLGDSTLFRISHFGFRISPEVAGRRRDFANWVADARNPLTARVMVNRIWQQLFGRGIAGNPNNFGATGKKPTHPELLDWLAAEFVDRGWSVKAMHRLIVTSEAYRRSSRHADPKTVAANDPGGTSYAVFRPRRLAAEELRDALLTASGELNPEVGGIPVRPELNPEVALQPRQVMGTFAPAWEPSPRPEQRHRRSIYALKLRGLRDPFLEVFNQPGPDTPCEFRETSTIAPQAFTLLNGDATRARALVLAARVLREKNSKEEAIDRVFRLAFGRLPTDAERDRCLAHWSAMTERHRGLTFAKSERPREMVREAVEENTGVKFKYTEALDSAADFVADLHPADVSVEVRGLMEVCLVLFNANEFVYVD
jgi:mono/diheme cytochrome c family protein